MPAWKRTLYIAVLVQVMSAIGFSSSVTFLSLYTQERPSVLGLPAEWSAGLVYGAQALSMMLTAPLWGALADRRGRKMMVIRASWGSAFFLGLMAFAQNVEQMIVLRIIQGGLTGVAPALAALVAAQAPRERSGYTMGLLQMSIWLGAAGGPLVGGLLADAFGYQANFIVTAVMLGGAGLLMLVGVTEVFEERQTTTQSHLVNQWREVILLPGVSLTYFIKAVNWMTLTMLVPFAPLLVASVVQNEPHLNTITGAILGASALSTTLSSYVLGKWSDRVGQRRVLTASMLLCALLYFPHALVGNVWQLAVLQILVGIAIGGTLPTLSALLAGYTPPGTEGAVYGLDSSVTAAARAVAPLLAAGIATEFGVRAIFIAVGAIFLLAVGTVVMRLPLSEVERRNTEAYFNRR
jgi:DHA1 family multidrug resistance protein-like MFS transporter